MKSLSQSCEEALEAEREGRSSVFRFVNDNVCNWSCLVVYLYENKCSPKGRITHRNNMCTRYGFYSNKSARRTLRSLSSLFYRLSVCFLSPASLLLSAGGASDSQEMRQGKQMQSPNAARSLYRHDKLAPLLENLEGGWKLLRLHLA